MLGESRLTSDVWQFMSDLYSDVCDQILHYKDHRDPLVRRAVIELIPTLASYNTPMFQAHYLHQAMLFLLSQLKKDRGDRTTGECPEGVAHL